MPKQHLPILKICSCPCQAGPNAAGRGLQPPCEDAQEALLGHRFLHPFGHGVTKAQQGHCGACAAKFHNGLIQPQAGEDDAQHHIGDQNAARGHFGAVDEHLADGADYAGREKGLHIDHIKHPPPNKRDGKYLVCSGPGWMKWG